MNDDSRLRERFALLRRADAASAPSFERVLSRPHRRPRETRWKAGLGASLVLAPVTVFLIRVAPLTGPRKVPAAAPMLADWRAPTDFLLDTSGRQLLHTIPNLGRDFSTGPGTSPPNRKTTPMPRAGREHS